MKQLEVVYEYTADDRYCTDSIKIPMDVLKTILALHLRYNEQEETINVEEVRLTGINTITLTL